MQVCEIKKALSHERLLHLKRNFMCWLWNAKRPLKLEWWQLMNIHRSRRQEIFAHLILRNITPNERRLHLLELENCGREMTIVRKEKMQWTKRVSHHQVGKEFSGHFSRGESSSTRCKWIGMLSVCTYKYGSISHTSVGLNLDRMCGNMGVLFSFSTISSYKRAEVWENFPHFWVLFSSFSTTSNLTPSFGYREQKCGKISHTSECR